MARFPGLDCVLRSAFMLGFRKRVSRLPKDGFSPRDSSADVALEPVQPDALSGYLVIAILHAPHTEKLRVHGVYID